MWPLRGSIRVHLSSNLAFFGGLIQSLRGLKQKGQGTNQHGCWFTLGPPFPCHDPPATTTYLASNSYSVWAFEDIFFLLLQIKFHKFDKFTSSMITQSTLPGIFLWIFSSFACLKKPVFSKRDLLWWKVPTRLYSTGIVWPLSNT